MSSKGSRKRRRESPSYDDYFAGDTHEGSGGSRYINPARLARHQSPSSNEFQSSVPFSRRYHTRSQHSDYRRESDEEQQRPGRQRSASPRQEKSPYRTSSPPYLFRDPSLSPAHRLSRLSPPSKRVEPTDDYLLTSREHSRRVDDPTQSRKLVVLDLNGSLLLRSQHARKAGRGTQHRVRTVYPRPYLPAFRSYVFHEETKRWLDVMVWSSAQPHNVHDMVDKCFREKKEELRAIWARDTLGLNQNEYHQKTQTLKDLERPWTELGDSAEGYTRHSALTTILIDDSPLKAALQPWNHLCIKEYVAETRTSDLVVANWEAARRRLHEAQEALERERCRKEDLKKQEEDEAEMRRQEEEKMMNDAINNPENTKVIRELAMVNGVMLGEERLMKKVLKEVVMVDGEMVGEHEDEGPIVEGTEKLTAKNRKRKLKRQLARKEFLLRKKEAITQETATAAQDDGEIEEGEIDSAELEQEHESEEMRLEALAPTMKYDETLLAVIGVLDHIKYESSVAGWMRHGGLLNVEVAEDASRLSNNPSGSPPKKRRINETDSFNAGHTPSSPATLPPSSSQIHPFPSDRPSSPPSSPPSQVEKRDEEAQTNVPLISSDIPEDPRPPSTLWFERTSVLSYWADRGRRALQALNIPAESGVTPV